jgi:hypothetical protein
MPMTALVEAWNGSEVVDTHRLMPMTALVEA